MDQLNEISLDGFQVVSGDYFCATTRTSEPTLTLWDGRIGFSKQDIILLNTCEHIRVHIHPTDKKMIVIPTTSKDKDALRWVKRLNPVEARGISCVKFTDNLYKSWNLDKNYVYRAYGKLVTSANKVMLLFDFRDCEKWKRPEVKDAKK